MKYDVDDLLLLNMAGVGYVRLKKLTECFSTLDRALRADKETLKRVEGIGPQFAEKIAGVKNNTEALKRERRLIEKGNITVLSLSDKDYPEILKNIYDPPLVLYVKGKITGEDKIAVALVGSRTASVYGVNVCKNLAQSLASSGITIVSGLARGIDSAAHTGALLSGGRTIAVLGNGLGSIYPPENKDLAEKIAQRGAVISEFPIEAPPLPQYFPIRNRIISGLSLGTVVVEAAEKSGALITASCALEQGREVFAVPGRAGSPTSKGTHWLIREGAKLVEDPKDIIEELNLNLIPSGLNRPVLSVLDLEEKKVYDALSDEPEHIDIIINKSNMPPQNVARLLLKLELKKLVKELPGKNFITK